MNGTTDDLSSSWMYIKEGNASFVIGHKKEHIIYRMWKAYPNNDTTKNSRKAECQLKIDYIRNVLQPLLSRFVVVPTCMPVTAEFVRSVSESFEGQRPVKRKGKVVDPSQRYVLSQPNFCYLGQGSCLASEERSTLTIEIKSKLGYIPTNQHAIPGSENVGDVCYFCMQQHLKRKEGMWSYISKYCPVNLFSGNQKKMRVALEGLFSTPQNNLCIFKDGKRIYPSEGKSPPTKEEQEEVAMAIQSWFRSDEVMSHESLGFRDCFTKRPCIQDIITLVIEALCKPDNDVRNDGHSTSLPWKRCLSGSAPTCNTVSGDAQSHCLLPLGCLLHRLLMTQHLDTHGIQFIHPLYQRYGDMIREGSTPEVSDQLLLEGPYTSGYLRPHPDSLPLHNLEDIPGLPLGDCVALLRGYAVSRTARDCSIMLTLRPSDDPASISDKELVSVGGRKFQFACHLIDLDPKTPSKIPQYYKLEQQILAAYLDR